MAQPNENAQVATRARIEAALDEAIDDMENGRVQTIDEACELG